MSEREISRSVQAADDFLATLQRVADTFNDLLSTEIQDWIVKGFIDTYRKVYTISNDTKVVSRLIELMSFPYFVAFAEKHYLELVFSREQNHYPDLTFIDGAGHKPAVDLKSAYRVDSARVRTMTLGALAGYFRKRESTKNVTYFAGTIRGTSSSALSTPEPLSGLMSSKPLRPTGLKRFLPW